MYCGMCEDCAYQNDNYTCCNKKSDQYGTTVMSEGCKYWKCGNNFDENVDADFDDAW